MGASTCGRQIAAVCSCVLALCLLSCGLEGSPQPPSLHLPKPISSLSASRAGDQVMLTWKTPKETTDKLKLQSPVRLRICRSADGAACVTVATVSATPGQSSTYIDTLPSALATGPIRPIHYEIFGLNRRSKTAGASNPVMVLAGQAPPAIASLFATEIRQGVVLHWQPAANLAPKTFIELRRTLLTSPDNHRPDNHRLKPPNGLAPAPEPTEQTLRVRLGADTNDRGRALDEDVIFNRTYRYVAMRVMKQSVDGKSLRLASSASQPVVITTRNTFPPAAPTGLVAVPVSAAINGGTPEIDLSWSANTDPEFSQYFVYRQEVGAENNSAPQQIGPESGAGMIVAPEFRDLHVQPGQTYRYTVVAVDNAGNRSAPSQEVTATVPSS